MRGIYQRGKNKIYWIRYADLTGKMHFESSGSKFFRDAQALLTERRKAIQDGKNPLPIRKIKNHTFRELADNYLKFSQKQKSFKNKAKVIGLLLREFGDLPLRMFSTLLVEEYQSKLIAQGKKPATANRYLAELKSMLNKAVQWEMSSEDILKKVRAVKQLPTNNARLRYLSREECQELIKNCKPHLKSIVITALQTGMRKSEILSLEWEKNVDLKHGFILLDHTKNGSRREIPINATLRATLQMIVRRLDTSLVFTDENGKRFKDVRRPFQSALRRSGIKDFNFHDLRHTAASHLVMNGVDLSTVKEILGHRDIKMTCRYAHLSKGHVRNALENLNLNITY